MHTHADMKLKNKNASRASSVSPELRQGKSIFRFDDNRPAAIALKSFHDTAYKHPRRDSAQFVDHRPAAVARGVALGRVNANLTQPLQRIKSETLDGICKEENIPEHKLVEFLEHRGVTMRDLFLPPEQGGIWTETKVRGRIPAYRQWIANIYTEDKDGRAYATVQQGQFIISHLRHNITGLSTTGVGPCLVVSITSEKAQVFGLAHLDSVANVAATIQTMLDVGYHRAAVTGYMGGVEEYLASISVRFGGAQEMGAKLLNHLDGPQLLDKAAEAFASCGIRNIDRTAMKGTEFFQSRNLQDGFGIMTDSKTRYMDSLSRFDDYNAPESLTYNLLSNVIYSAIFSMDQKITADGEAVTKRDLIELAAKIAMDTIHEEETAEDNEGNRMARLTKGDKLRLLLDSMTSMIRGEELTSLELSHMLMGWR